MPGGIRVPPSPSRNQSFTPRQSTFQHRPMRPTGNANCQMKHEWFEKTVRAAARVNSNLSYTLTQLNRAQATATSVEALAVVHNKLQEILSTSINSLIQIRKNLRTEFIAGIKNIRFPPKAQPQPSTSSQDDDVIFISPTPSPVPPPLLPTTPSLSPITSVNLPPSVSLTKRSSTPSTPLTPLAPSTSLNPIPSTSKNNEKPKVFLRVKSLTALQNVPAECITIPDDPLPPPPPLTPIPKILDEITIIDNSPEKDAKKDDEKEANQESGIEKIDDEEKDGKSDEKSGENDVSEVQTDISPVAKEAEETVIEESETETATDGDKEVEISKEESEESNKDDRAEHSVAFNMKESPRELKKMLNTKVYITRSEEIDALVKRSFGLVNGDASD